MEDLNIVIGGAAGEGIQTIGEVLAEAISALGYAVFTWQENESRIRGGLNTSKGHEEDHTTDPVQRV